VAAPRMFNVTDAAADNAVRQSLAAVRHAIEMYMAQNGQPPGGDGNEATFKSEIEPFLRTFPVLPVGPGAARDDSVLMSGDLGPANGDAAPTEGWKYYFNTGTFIVNLDAATTTDAAVDYDDL
jgi:type II secretory pathway pseudopilin PulG